MNWPLVPASELMLKRGGTLNPTKFPDEVFELLSIPAFDRGSVDVVAGAEIGSSKSLVCPNDVLLSKIIPHVRRCWVVPEKRQRRQIGSGEWIIFRDQRFHPQFLKHWLTSDSFHRQFMNTVAGVGGSLVRARPSFVEKIQIPLPPLEEQKRIAAILDKADAIPKKRQQAIELADQFLKSVFLDMFGDPVTNPKKWMTMNIEQMAESKKGSIKRGPFGGALKKEIFVDSGYLVYEQYHALNNDFSFGRYFINEAKFQELKAFEVRPRDIIISCSGVNLGKLAEVPVGAKPGIINQALLKITLNSDLMLNPMFIQIFSHPNFKRAFYGDFRGAAIPNFPPMNTFKEFRFIVPPLEVQNDYLAIVRKIQEWKLNMQNSANRSLDLFSVLGKRVFT